MNPPARSLASTFLRNLSAETKAAEVARNLARTAVNDAIYFGRPQAMIDDLARKAAALETPQVQIEVPRAPLDPVSEEYAAVGGPRKWAEERVLNSAGARALEAAGGDPSPALEAIRTNELIKARVARMSPEERARSLAAIAIQAAEDARPGPAGRGYGREAALLAAGATGLGLASMRPAASPRAAEPVDMADIIEGIDVDLQDNIPDVVPDIDLGPTPDYSVTPDDFGSSLLSEESRPGPDGEIAGYDDMPIPLNDIRVQQAVQDLVRSGVPVDRAMRIIGGQDQLTTEELQGMLYGAN